MVEKNKMKESWEEKARVNAYHWVDSTEVDWDKEKYYQKGKTDVENYFLSHLRSSGISEEKMKSMNVLDIGCGTGRLMRGMAPYFASVDGIDISDEMISKAKVDNAEIKNLSFHVGDGVSLDVISNQKYDLIYSFIVFQHIPNRKFIKNYFLNSYKHLKDGGFFIAQVRGYPGKLMHGLSEKNYKGFDTFYIALNRKLGVPIPYVRKYNTVFGAFYKPFEIEGLAKRAGFSDIEIRKDEQDERYLWVFARKHKAMVK
jgi:2-polyprenyl-3-methyl-5-hydroxy-6-metoxy-1,4-benzoquinol methylase